MQVLTPHTDDLLEWPDEACCYRHELPEMTHRSDDYVTIPAYTPQWEDKVACLQ